MTIMSKDIAKVRRLFRRHVPEIANGAVKIRVVAREVGKETLAAVQAMKDGVCAVGSCVGKKGVSAKSIRRVLPGECFGVVLWSESPEELIRILLQPATVERVELDAKTKRATVTVTGDTSALDRNDGLRLRLLSKVCGWEVRLAET